MSEIRNLEPKAVWESFYALTQIPRPSGHLDKVRAFLLDWAKEHGIASQVDDAGNIIWRKAASPGMENRKTVTFQAHMDMVPQKAKDSTHNFETDPIEAYIDGEWVKARGTTLGADDGIGVATAMAVMATPGLTHGPLEALITVDEETTMYGVNHLAPGLLEGDILLNLDNETEGEMIVGSAGGMNLTATLEYKEEEYASEADETALRVTLKGLLGGHSGLQINEGRANANKLFVRILRSLVSDYEARLASWHGGNMRNAIPRESEAVVIVPTELVDDIKESLAAWQQTLTEEWGSIETALAIECEAVEAPFTVMPEEIQDSVINAIYAAHNGVFRFIPAFPEIVETSSNLAVVEVGGGAAKVLFLLRSSQESQLVCLRETLESGLAMAGMSIGTGGYYPAWQPDFNSPIVKLMERVYKEMTGRDNEVKVVHAGLECGLIGKVYPNMEMVSFGPTLRSPHTPDERCHIASVATYYDFVLRTLEQIPTKQ